MKAIIQWVLRTMMKDQTGIVRTMPKKDLVNFNAAMTAERLMRNGVDPNSLKNANQVENAINMIENAPRNQTMRIGEARGSGIKSAKIVDMEGKEIDPRSKIMGGKQAETEAEILARINRENKEGIARIQTRQKMLDDAIDNQSPSLSGDTRTDAVLVAEDLAERMGLVYDDLPIREQTKLYDQAYQGLSKMRFEARQTPKGAPPKITSKKDADSQESSYDDGPADFDPDADNETFAQGGRAGFFLGSKYPAGLALLREILKDVSKKGKELDKFQGVDLSALDMLRLSNPKRKNKLLEDVQGKVNIKEGIMATDTIRAQQQALRKQREGLTAGALKVAKEMKARDDAIAKRIAEEAEKTIIPQTKKMMMKGMGMSEEAAERAARDLAKAGQNMRLIDDSPRITEEGLLQLENVLKNLETAGKKKRDLNADGGRIGFKDGMTRRTFLKIFGGLVSLPIIGKVLAPLKLTRGVSKVPIIKTDNVPGKPEWFDQLVNKVIIEGDDVTKKFATAERQSIHQKTLDDGSVVRVTEDVDDGAVRVEYESKTNPYEETTQLEYKKPLPDEGTPDPKAEFSAAETGPVARSDSPKLDYEKDIEEFATGNVDELVTDFSKLKEYATGKKPTMKEIVEAKKKKDQAKKLTEGDFDAEFELMEKRQGQPFYDPSLPDDFASGGIARMLGE